jgi:glycosyltransferase involved in cell wall biosynthesis
VNRSFDVSVVIPTYEAPEKCCQAIASCLKLQNLSLEVFVIDDGGGVRAENRIYNRFAKYFCSSKSINAPSRKIIRYLYHTNQGAYKTRIFGAQNALGGYVKFLDHDDELYADVLEQEVLFARTQDVDVVMTDWEEIWPSDHKTLKVEKHNAPEYNDPILDFIEKGGVYTSAALYRKTIFDGIKPVSDWEPKLSDDWVIFGQVLLAGASYGTLHKCSYRWRHHHKQLSNNTPIGHTREFYHFLVWLEENLRANNCLTSMIKSALASSYTENAVFLCYCDPDWWKKIAVRIKRLDRHAHLKAGNAIVKLLVAAFGKQYGVRGYVALKNIFKPFPFSRDGD